ncbi:hypothetical protein GCM10011581_29580 [Saccharopolyspora subtropica]|uniref:Uncharacterized protein n=1 Tax=Saccharopolyspora thermophila TaxID=89367 RepID=A0A917NDN6_9PSEU|nr:hypothetical protein GCM10011581_29580 [Saccharopolyspora subtropica]
MSIHPLEVVEDAPMAGLVRWLGSYAREMQRARMVMRNPQSSIFARRNARG